MKHAIKNILRSFFIAVLFVGHGHGLSTAIRNVRVASEEFKRKREKFKDKLKEAFGTDFSVVTKSLIRDLENALLKFDLETAFDASAFPPEFAKGIPLTANEIKIIRAKDPKYLELLKQEAQKELFKLFFDIKELIKKKMGRAAELEPYNLYPYVKPGSGNQQEGYKLMMSRVKAKVLGIPQNQPFPDTSKANQARSDFEDQLIVAHYQIVARILYYLQIVFDNLKQIALKTTKEDYKKRYTERYETLLKKHLTFKTKAEEEEFHFFIGKVLGIEKDDPEWANSVEITTDYIRGITLLEGQIPIAISDFLFRGGIVAIGILPLSDETLKKIASFLKISVKETDWQRAVKQKLDPLINTETQALKDERKKITDLIEFTEESLDNDVDNKFEKEKQEIELKIIQLKNKKKSLEKFQLFRTKKQKETQLKDVFNQISTEEENLKKYTDDDPEKQKKRILKKKMEDISKYVSNGIPKEEYLTVVQKYPAPVTETIPDPVDIRRMLILNKRKIYDRFVYKQVALAYQLWNMIKGYLAPEEKNKFLEQYIEATKKLIDRRRRIPPHKAKPFDTWKDKVVPEDDSAWNKICNEIEKAAENANNKKGFLDALKKMKKAFKTYESNFKIALEYAKEKFDEALQPWEQELQKRAPDEYQKYILRKLVTKEERKKSIQELEQKQNALQLAPTIYEQQEFKKELDEQIKKIKAKQEQLAQAIEKRNKPQMEVHQNELLALREEFEKKVEKWQEASVTKQYTDLQTKLKKLDDLTKIEIASATKIRDEIKKLEYGFSDDDKDKAKYLRDTLKEQEKEAQKNYTNLVGKLATINRKIQAKEFEEAKKLTEKAERKRKDAKNSLKETGKDFQEAKSAAKEFLEEKQSAIEKLRRERKEKEEELNKLKQDLVDLYKTVEQLKQNHQQTLSEIQEGKIAKAQINTAKTHIKKLEKHTENLENQQRHLKIAIKKAEESLKVINKLLSNPKLEKASEEMDNLKPIMKSIQTKMRNFKKAKKEAEHTMIFGRLTFAPQDKKTFNLATSNFQQQLSTVKTGTTAIAQPIDKNYEALLNRITLLGQQLQEKDPKAKDTRTEVHVYIGEFLKGKNTIESALRQNQSNEDSKKIDQNIGTGNVQKIPQIVGKQNDNAIDNLTQANTNYQNSLVNLIDAKLGELEKKWDNEKFKDLSNNIDELTNSLLKSKTEFDTKLEQQTKTLLAAVQFKANQDTVSHLEETLNKKIKQTEQNIQSVSDENKKERENLQNELNQLKTELNTKVEEIKELQTEQAKNFQEKINGKIQNIETLNNQLSEQIKNAKKVHNKQTMLINKALDKAHESNQLTNENKKNIKSFIETQSTELTEINKKIMNQVKHELETNKNQMDKTIEKLTEAQAKNLEKEKQESKDELIKQKEEYNKKIESLNSKINKLEDKTTTNKTQLAQEIETQKTLLESLFAEKRKFEETINKQTAKHTEQIETLTKSIDEINEKYDDATGDINQQNQVIAELKDKTNKLQELENNQKELQEKLAKVTTRLKETKRRQIEQEKKQLEFTKKLHEKLKIDTKQVVLLKTEEIVLREKPSEKEKEERKKIENLIKEKEDTIISELTTPKDYEDALSLYNRIEIKYEEQLPEKLAKLLESAKKQSNLVREAYEEHTNADARQKALSAFKETISKHLENTFKKMLDEVKKKNLTAQQDYQEKLNSFNETLETIQREIRETKGRSVVIQQSKPQAFFTRFMSKLKRKKKK